MGRKISEPEKRAQSLFAHFKLTEIQRNDGSRNPESIYFNDDGKGTSLIKNRSLYSDYPPSSSKSPKNYIRVVPDCLFRSDYIEIKGNISGKDWGSLPRDSLNDNIRLSLLRMKIGSVQNIVKKYHDLEKQEQEMVSHVLMCYSRSNPMDRYYLHWDSIIKVIPSPKENLAETVLHYHNMRFPIKLVSGMQNQERRLFVIDYEIMNQWDKLRLEYQL